MHIHIFIKHYRLSKLTDACIASIPDGCASVSNEHTAYLSVIDGSAEEAPFVQRAVAPPATIMPLMPNLGLIASFNWAIQQQKADFYICLNNDVVLAPRWLEGMVKVLQMNHRIGIVAPLYDQEDGGWLHFPAPAYDSPSWKPYLALNLPEPGNYRILPHVDNCAWGFTQRLINSIGLPDERFAGAGWGANLDYCWRAREAGFLVVAADGAFVHHGHRKTWGQEPGYVEAQTEMRDRLLKEKYGGRRIW